ncbi:hypothetical protein BH24ACT22_BH24ACT22_20750 [soil metagenome]
MHSVDVNCISTVSRYLENLECETMVDGLDEADADAVALVTSSDRPEKDLEDMANDLLPLLGGS